MTLNEFKAWFEGFSEIMQGPPNEEQWKRIKDRVGEITGTPVAYPVFIDRYVTPYRRWYDAPMWLSGTSPTDIGSVPYSQAKASAVDSVKHFDSYKAMTAAGRAEYLSLSQ